MHSGVHPLRRIFQMTYRFSKKSQLTQKIPVSGLAITRSFCYTWKHSGTVTNDFNFFFKKVPQLDIGFNTTVLVVCIMPSLVTLFIAVPSTFFLLLWEGYSLLFTVATPTKHFTKRLGRYREISIWIPPNKTTTATK
jgi:hypothetical protein